MTREVKETPRKLDQILTIAAGKIERFYREFAGGEIDPAPKANHRTRANGGDAQNHTPKKSPEDWARIETVPDAWREYYPGKTQSEADFGLCMHYAWKYHNNPALIDQAFRKSVLMRDKWDEHGGDYGQRTIKNAIAAGEKPNRRTDGEDVKKDEKKTTQAEKLVEIGRACELFHTPHKVPYAGITVDEHREFWALKSDAFEQHLTYRFFQETGGGPSDAAVREAVRTLSSIARYQGEEHEVHLRVAAADDGTIWVDLGDDRWRTIKIDASGWEVVGNSPLRFRRPAGSMPLPEPERGGHIRELRPFINVATNYEFVLVVSCVIDYLLGRGPFPQLYFLGEQGSTKTTAARASRSLVDPFKPPLCTFPETERDLYVHAEANWIVGFDNVSYISNAMSDSLCRLSTGGGHTHRSLYTNAEAYLLDATRPIILNGITEAASRADLLDRSVMVNCPRLKRGARLSEEKFLEHFRKAQPRILGVLLNGVSAALRNYERVEQEMLEKPRMAAFAVWATAAESGLGFKPGTFMKAYEENRKFINEIPLEASPIASHLETLAARINRDKNLPVGWRGNAADLLAALNGLEGIGVDGKRAPKHWPESPRKLSAEIKRLATNLVEAGVEVEFSSPGHARKRTITLIARDKPEEEQETPPISPTSPNNADSDIYVDDGCGDVRSTVTGETSETAPDANANKQHHQHHQFGNVPGTKETSPFLDTSPETSPREVAENKRTGDIGDVGDVYSPPFRSVSHLSACKRVRKAGARPEPHSSPAPDVGDPGSTGSFPDYDHNDPERQEYDRAPAFRKIVRHAGERGVVDPRDMRDTFVLPALLETEYIREMLHRGWHERDGTDGTRWRYRGPKAIATDFDDEYAQRGFEEEK